MGINWSRLVWRDVCALVWLAVMIPVFAVKVAWRIGRGVAHLARRHA